MPEGTDLFARKAVSLKAYVVAVLFFITEGVIQVDVPYQICFNLIVFIFIYHIVPVLPKFFNGIYNFSNH